jgi:hypothetical protein
MRMSGFLFATLLVPCLIPAHAYAQGGIDPRAEEQNDLYRTEPYRKHHDTRHGHDHTYPDRGAILRDLPRGAVVVNYAGLSYRFHDGVWFEPRGPAFMVVEPPIGVMVPTLPSFATPVAHGREAYLYANGIFYLPRPELGGYEVVNDPGEVTPLDRGGAVVGGPPSAAPAGPGLTPQSSATLLATSPVAGSPAATPTSASTATLAALAPAATLAATAPTSALTASQSAAAVAASQPAGTLAPSVRTAAVPVQTPGSTSLVAPAAGAMPASLPAATLASAPAATLAAAPTAAVPSSAPAATSPASGTTAALPASATAATLATVAPTAAPTTLPAGSSSPPPPSPQMGPSTLQTGTKVFVYPRNGQSADQQAHDRYECYRFAVTQSGFDPMHSTGPAPQSSRAESQSDYDRAQAACLEGRGYTIR